MTTSTTASTTSDDLQKITTDINHPVYRQLAQMMGLLEEPQIGVYVGSVSLDQDSSKTNENQVYSTIDSENEEEEDDGITSSSGQKVYIHWHKRLTNESKGLETEISGRKRFPSVYVTKFGNVEDVIIENSKKRAAEISQKIGLKGIGEYFLDEESQGILLRPGFVQYGVQISEEKHVMRRLYFTSYSLKNTGQVNSQRKPGAPLFVFITSPPFCQTLVKPKIVYLFSSYTDRDFVSVIENDTHLVACELAKMGYDCLSVDPVGADNVPSFYQDFLYKRDQATMSEAMSNQPDLLWEIPIRDIMAINSLVALYLMNPEGGLPLHPNASKQRKLVVVSNLFATRVANLIRGSSLVDQICSEVIGVDLSESCHPFTTNNYVKEFINQVQNFCEPFSKFSMKLYNPSSELRENASLEFLKMFAALCVGNRSEMIKKVEANPKSGEITEAMSPNPIYESEEEEDPKSISMETNEMSDTDEKSQVVNASRFSSSVPSSFGSTTDPETRREQRVLSFMLSPQIGENMSSVFPKTLDPLTKIISYSSFKLLENFHEDDYEISMLNDKIQKMNLGPATQEGKQTMSSALKRRDDMFHKSLPKSTKNQDEFSHSMDRRPKLKDLLDVNSPIQTKSHVTNILSGMVSSVNYFFFLQQSCHMIRLCLDRENFENIIKEIPTIYQTTVTTPPMDTIYALTNQVLANKFTDANGAPLTTPFLFDPNAFSGTNTQPEESSSHLPRDTEKTEKKKLTVFSFTKMDESDKKFTGSIFEQFIQQLDNYVGFLDCLERPGLVAELLKSVVDLTSSVNVV